MHTPYHERLKHPCDFKVKYKFYTKEEGGRNQLPHQGIRSDFFYYHEENPNENRIFMIHPEFEDEHGHLIEAGLVLPEGTARMWILIPERRIYHRGKIEIGTIGYFREGSMVSGICEVIEIVGLHSNPTH